VQPPVWEPARRPATADAREAAARSAASSTSPTAVAEARRATGARSALRIGAVPTIALARLQRFLAALSERAPSLHPQVTHMASLEQISRLRSGELDFGVLHLPQPYPDIESEALSNGDRTVALLGPRTSLDRKAGDRPRGRERRDARDVPPLAESEGLRLVAGGRWKQPATAVATIRREGHGSA
jgi:DNA-binding transcriptional LysR family regulator